jgi:hypothetical protein
MMLKNKGQARNKALIEVGFDPAHPLEPATVGNTAYLGART